MHDYYSKVADPIYDTWSDSYIHEWLVAHQIGPYDTTPPPRESLIARMKQYYYDFTQ